MDESVSNSTQLDRDIKDKGETCILGMEEFETVMLKNENKEVDAAYLIRTHTDEIWMLTKEICRIGKERKKVDIYISGNEAIGRLHAIIKIKEKNYYLIDNNSSNYTLLNGRKLVSGTETQIRDGDIIKLANEEFIFKIE